MEVDALDVHLANHIVRLFETQRWETYFRGIAIISNIVHADGFSGADN